MLRSLLARARRRVQSRAFQAFIAWAAVLALAVGPTASVWHFILVPHVRCEHGKLTHLRSEPTQAAAPRANKPEALPGSALDDAGHDHCGVASLARTIAAPHAARTQHVTVATIARAEAVTEEGVLPTRRALLLCAPKTSPPRAS